GGGAAPGGRVRGDRRLPGAPGRGGGSPDAGARLGLASGDLGEPLTRDELHRIAAATGADVPFFLQSGPQLATGDGTVLRPVDLPEDYHVLIALADDVTKESTGAVYTDFDRCGGAIGFESRADA